MAAIDLGRFIKSRRKSLGLTQVELAEAIGTSASYISMIESGKKQWPKRFIAKIADALDVTEYQLAVEAGIIYASSQDALPRIAMRLGRGTLIGLAQHRDEDLAMLVASFLVAGDEEKFAMFLTQLKLAIGLTVMYGDEAMEQLAAMVETMRHDTAEDVIDAVRKALAPST